VAAQPPEELAPFFAITEIRLGVFAANLEESASEQAETVINGEVLFGKIPGHYSDPLWDYFLRPRLHLGFSLTPDEGGTSQAYAGVTWEFRLNDWAFIEASFGGAVHDGPTDGDDPDSYGCAVNFRESASLGFDLSERMRLLFTVDHMSNAGLCDQNQGQTNAGVRLGYRW
jgi:lipid A 3-O-deacylase